MEPREVLKRLEAASWDDDLWCHPELVDEVEAIVEENEAMKNAIREIWRVYILGDDPIEPVIKEAMRKFGMGAEVW
jgi:hypothetical protein